MADRPGRAWLRGLVALVVLGLVAWVAALFLLKARPAPAPTDGGKSVGTVSGPGSDEKRTYRSEHYRFQLRYPSEWTLNENGEGKAPEGEYLTVTLIPKRSPGAAPNDVTPSKTLTPLVLEVVPDPQSFDAAAVVRMKWGSLPTNVTAATSTIDVAGTDGVEVHITTPAKNGREAQHRFETIAVVGKRMFLAHFESTDAEEYDAMAAEARRVMASLETY